MRTNLRNKMLCVLISFLAILCVATMSFGMLKSKQAVASSDPTETEFYVDGASIRQVTGSSGIRFGTILTKTGWEKIITQYPADTYDYKLYTVIDKTGNTDAKEEREYVFDSFTFGENETEKLFWATVTYDNLTPEQASIAYTVPLTATTKIDVLNKGTTTVVDTFEPDGNEISRTIREVAWKAIEDGEVGEMLTTYRGTTSTVNTKKEFDAWGEKFSISEITEDVKGVYVGENKAESFTLIDNVLSVDWSNVEDKSKTQKISIVTDSGIIEYSNCEPVYLLRQKTASKLRTVPDGAQIRMIENINMDGVTFDASDNVVKQLILDGGGFTISNLKSTPCASANNSHIMTGLFEGLEASTIKNLAIVNFSCDKLNLEKPEALIALNVNNTFTMQNCYIQTNSISYNSAVIARTNNNTKIKIENTYISTSSWASYILIAGSGSTPIELNNCHFTGGSKTLVSQASTCQITKVDKGYAIHNDVTDAYVAIVNSNDQTQLKTFFEKYDGKLVTPLANTKADMEKFLLAESGYFVLTEDVDTNTFINWNNNSGYSSKVFTGVVNGAGHTLAAYDVRRRADGSTAITPLWDTVSNTTLKNVKITLSGEGKVRADSGIIAYVVNSLTLENVYFDLPTFASAVNSLNYNYTGILGRQGSLANVNMSNVVMNLGETESPNVGYLIGYYTAGAKIDLTNKNVYFMGGSRRCFTYWEEHQTHDDDNYVTGANIYENYNAFKQAYNAENSTVNLSPELKKLMGITEIE